MMRANYWNVNKNIVPDRYPIPKINELIDTLGQNYPTIFPSLNCQVKVAIEDIAI